MSCERQVPYAVMNYRTLVKAFFKSLKEGLKGRGAIRTPARMRGVMVSLPDLWLEPRFLYERDVVRDNGTYLNLALGHTFALVDGRTLTAEF